MSSRISEQLLCLCLLKYHRFFTQNMFPVFQSRPDIRIVCFMWRSYIDGIYRLIKFLYAFICVDLPPPRKVLCALPVRIIYSLCTYAADKLHLYNKPLRNPACANNTNPLNPFILRPKHGTRNIFCPFQIDHLAVILHIVKYAHPVRSYRKDINLILFDILYLLALRFLHDNLISKSRLSHIFNPGCQRVHHI